MISVTSTTNEYIIQPALNEKHRKTLDWLSACVLWKQECNFFQKILDQYAPRFIEVNDKKKIGHFQSLLIFYKSEVIDELQKKLREHEKNLAEMLQKKDETKIQYFKEHESIMQSLQSFSAGFAEYKEEFFSFIEKGMTK